MSSRPLLTVSAAAAQLGCSPKTLMRRVARGEIGVVRGESHQVTRARRDRAPETYIRATVRFRPSDLEAWIRAHHHPAHRPASTHDPFDGLEPLAESYHPPADAVRRFS